MHHPRCVQRQTTIKMCVTEFGGAGRIVHTGYNILNKRINPQHIISTTFYITMHNHTVDVAVRMPIHCQQQVTLIRLCLGLVHLVERTVGVLKRITRYLYSHSPLPIPTHENPEPLLGRFLTIRKPNRRENHTARDEPHQRQTAQPPNRSSHQTNDRHQKSTRQHTERKHCDANHNLRIRSRSRSPLNGRHRGQHLDQHVGVQQKRHNLAGKMHIHPARVCGA